MRMSASNSGNGTHDRIQFGLTALLLACTIVLGGAQGGQGMLGDLICQWLSLLLLAWLLLRWHWQSFSTAAPAYAKAVLLLPLLLPLLQLVPIPLDWWQQIGARHLLATELAAVGVSVPAHVSLAPLWAERALWSLLPATALAWSVLYLPGRAQRHLLVLLVVLAALALLLGLAQRAQGPYSELRFYPYANLTDATGFFANRNHLALLLLMALPLSIAAAAWFTTHWLAGYSGAFFRALPALAMAVYLILGIAMTRSRSGILLCALAIALALPMVLGLRRERGRRRVVAVIAALGLLLTVQFALTGILQRMHRGVLEDSRWGLVQGTLQAASANAPLGSGLGTFRDVYPAYGQSPLIAHAANHAHNDWLELWLEGGWPFAMLALAFVLFFVWAGFQVWRRHDDEALLLRTRAAWIGLLLALLHALVDYALHTTADMGVFALLTAVLLAGLAGLRPPRRQPVTPPRG